MGKYMRKRKGVGEVAVMDMTQQGSMGVRTRARTLALEQGRKLAQQAQNSGNAQQQEEPKDEPEEEQQQKVEEDHEEPEQQQQQQQQQQEEEAEAPSQGEKQAVETLQITSCYRLRSRKLSEKATSAVAADRDLNTRKRNSPAEVRVGEESRLKPDGGPKFKQARYSRMRPAEAAARNPAEVAGSNEGGGGSGGRNLRPSTRGRSATPGLAAAAAETKAPVSELSGTKRRANTRSNATSLPRNRNNKVPEIPVPEAEQPEEEGVVVPPTTPTAKAAGSPVAAPEEEEAADVGVIDRHSSLQQREDGDASEGGQQHPKSLEVEASFGDNAFCDNNAMEQDRFSTKDSEISRPSTRSRNVRESTPSSYSRDQDGDAPEACSRQPTPQDGWRPCSRRRLFDAPSATELDDFFFAAEDREHQRFAERYNFDPVNDVPMPGRFEWTKVEESKATPGAAGESSPVLPQEPGA